MRTSWLNITVFLIGLLVAGELFPQPATNSSPEESAQTENSPSPSKTGEEDEKTDDPIFDAYLGLGYYQWNVPAQRSSGSGNRAFASFKQEFDPFLVKKLNLSFLNLYGLEGSLNYFTDKLNAGLSSSESSLDAADKATADNIEEIAGLLRYAFSDSFRIKTDIARRNFSGRVTYQANTSDIDTNTDTIGPVYFYRSNGNYRDLTDGETITWGTNRVDMSLDIETEARISKWYSQGFLIGYRRTSYTAPASFTLTEKNRNLISYGNYFESEHVLHSLDYGLYSTVHFDPLGFRYIIPSSAGIYNVSNPWIETTNKKFSLSVSTYRGMAELFYQTRNLKITLGAEAAFHSVQVDHTVNLKRDIFLYHQGRSIPVARGAEMGIETNRTEILWGPYIHIHYVY